MTALSPHRAAIRVAETAERFGDAYRLDLGALAGLTKSSVRHVAFDFGTDLVLVPRKAIADPLRELSAKRMRLAAFIERDALVWRFHERGWLRFKGKLKRSPNQLPPGTVRVPIANPDDTHVRETAEADDRTARWRPLMRKLDRSNVANRFAYTRDNWSVVTDTIFAFALRDNLGAAPAGYEPPSKVAGVVARFLELFEHADFGLLESAELRPHLSLARKSKDAPYLITFRDGREHAIFDGRVLEIAMRGLSLDGARAKIESRSRCLLVEAANGEWRLIVASIKPESVSEIDATLDIRKR